MTTCRAPGCGARTTRYGRHCNSHKSRLRRHGDAEQETITKTDLKPYLDLIERRRLTNSTNTFWAALEQRWISVCGDAEATIAFLSFRAGLRSDLQSAHELLKLRSSCDPLAVIDTTMAMFMMMEMEPRRFRSDDAFRLQLVRRVRGLTETNAGRWFDHRSGRVKRAYRDLPPRTARTMASVLAKAFGGGGLTLAKLEQRDGEDRLRASDALADGAATLT
jgi:hypothetical protein